MEKCVVFSERAFVSLMVETKEKAETETGGVFLGYRTENIWYIIESVDPGPKSIFQKNYFEYDQDYVNHLINKVSRLYVLPLELIGLWHRHPGSFDSFSKTDDGTNTKYAALCGEGAISVLVNIDPYFRLTVYLVTLPLKYEKIKFIVGDSYIPYKLLKMKSASILQKEMGHLASPKDNQEKVSKIEFKKFSFQKTICWLLQQEAHSHIKISSISLSKDKEFDDMLFILEKLDEDIQFLSQFGINCQMRMCPEGYLVLQTYTSQTRTLAVPELPFGLKDKEVVFIFNEYIYKYYSGLFKKAYLAFLLKEGVTN